MKAARLRLLLCVAMFFGWLGYLAYLVANRPRTPDDRPLVISRAQLMGSDADVIAFVQSPSLPIKVEQVLWKADAVPLAEGQDIKVDHIDQAQARAASKLAEEPKPDFQEPGRYLIPLRYHPDSKTYSVARVPISPGFYPPPWTTEDDRDNQAEPLAWSDPVTRWPIYRIYPVTDEALAQYKKARGIE